MFLGTVVYALVNSVILALIAIGFNLTFGISGIANFAYGALYIFSAYTSWMLLNLLKLPYFLSAAISILLTALLGALMYRFVLQRVRGQVLSEVIATFAIGLAILELFRYLGFVGFEYTLPVFIDQSFLILGVYVDMQRILVVIIGILLVLGLWFYPSHVIGACLQGNSSGRTHGSLSRNRFRLDCDSGRIVWCWLSGYCSHDYYPFGQYCSKRGIRCVDQSLGSVHYRGPGQYRRRDRGQFHHRLCGTLYRFLHRLSLDDDCQSGCHTHCIDRQAFRPVRKAKRARGKNLVDWGLGISDCGLKKIRPIKIRSLFN